MLVSAADNIITKYRSKAVIGRPKTAIVDLMVILPI